MFTLLSACTDGVDPRVAFEKGDYQKALPIWHMMVEQGDLDAQNFLATHYQFGLGIKQDFSLARSWYTKAATDGHPDAQKNLGSMYESGTGIPQNFEQAFIWFYAAHRQGHQKASVSLKRIVAMNKLTPNHQLILKEKAREYILNDVLGVSNSDY